MVAADLAVKRQDGPAGARINQIAAVAGDSQAIQPVGRLLMRPGHGGLVLIGTGG